MPMREIVQLSEPKEGISLGAAGLLEATGGSSGSAPGGVSGSQSSSAGPGAPPGASSQPSSGPANAAEEGAEGGHDNEQPNVPRFPSVVDQAQTFWCARYAAARGFVKEAELTSLQIFYSGVLTHFINLGNPELLTNIGVVPTELSSRFLITAGQNYEEHYIANVEISRIDNFRDRMYEITTSGTYLASYVHAPSAEEVSRPGSFCCKCSAGAPSRHCVYVENVTHYSFRCVNSWGTSENNLTLDIDRQDLIIYKVSVGFVRRD